MLGEPEGETALLACDEAPAALEQPMLNQDGEPAPSIAVHLALLLQALDLEHLEQVAVLGLHRLLNDIEPALVGVVLDILDDLLLRVQGALLVRIPRPSFSDVDLPSEPGEGGVESSGREGPHDDEDKKGGGSCVGEELEEEEAHARDDGGGRDGTTASGRGEGAEGAER